VTTRFAATEDAEDVKDLHGNGPNAQVRHLQLVLKFFWESETDQLGDYELLPLARLERQGDAIVLSEDVYSAVFEPVGRACIGTSDQGG
jgi:type VI secretion system protein ImpJ